jgi:transcriptional regulator with XRE-family HTH domain
VSRRAGVHANVVGRLERAIYNPTVIVLAAVAEALDAGLADLLKP